MGDPSAEITEEQRDAAQLAKSKAVDAMSQGKCLSIHDYLVFFFFNKSLNSCFLDFLLVGQLTFL